MTLDTYGVELYTTYKVLTQPREGTFITVGQEHALL